MEASATTLSIESFSYRWLINLKSSFDHDSSSSFYEESFIVMDPKTTPSKRFLLQEDQTHKQYDDDDDDDDEFNFPTIANIPTSQDHDYGLSTTTTTIVYAEELFSNGLLMPLFLNNNPSSKSFDSSSNSDMRTTISDDVSLESSSSSSSSSSTTTIVVSSVLSSTNKSFAKKFYWRSLSKRVLKKYLGFLRPLYHRVQRSPQRLNIHGTRTETIDARRKPLVVTAGCHEFEEGSIYEAVLHCKKSIGMSDHHVSVFG